MWCCVQDAFCVVPLVAPDYVHWSPLFTRLAAPDASPSPLLRVLGDATAALASAALLRGGATGAALLAQAGQGPGPGSTLPSSSSASLCPILIREV